MDQAINHSVGAAPVGEFLHLDESGEVKRGWKKKKNRVTVHAFLSDQNIYTSTTFVPIIVFPSAGQLLLRTCGDGTNQSLRAGPPPEEGGRQEGGSDKGGNRVSFQSPGYIFLGLRFKFCANTCSVRLWTRQ